ncbi:MAG: PAS domain S-box protein [Coleofasciculaceae cyanobacterium SM2_3_26]|nr:PAS domain S-box protein [Coleofasciculaceae cyanobacterium SM2_3_26]
MGWSLFISQSTNGRFYNVTIEHLLGKTDADLHGNSKEAERFLEENRRIIQTQKELFLAEEQVTHPVLGGQWLQWHKRPIQLPDRNMLGVFGVGVNITARKQTELFLQESERRFAALAEMAPVGIFHADLTGNCTYVNDRYCQITGYPAVEVMQQGWQQCLHPDDRHWVMAEWQKSIREQHSVRLEFRYQQPDGTVKWVYGQSVVERDDDGQAIGYMGTLTDISDRKHIETQLNLKNNLLAKIACKEPLSDVFHSLIFSVEQILDGALCSILLVDAEHRLRHGAAPNLPLEYCQAIDGIQAGDGVGSCGTAIARNQTIIVTDIATDPLWQKYKDVALQYGLRACWSTPIATSDGRVVGTFGIYYRKVRSPQPDELDIMLGMANIAGIAIERQQAEVALQKSEAHLRALVHALPDLIVRVNRTGIYLEFAASPTFYVIGNIPDLVGTHIFESLPPALAQKHMKFIEQALQTNSIQLYEQEFFINGKTQFEEARVVPYNEDEVLILVRDISDRKQAEQQLQNLIAGTAATTGQDFFPALVRHITEALSVSYAIVTEYVDDTLHVLAFWADGALQPGFSYHPAKTPCERGITRGQVLLWVSGAAAVPDRFRPGENGGRELPGHCLTQCRGAGDRQFVYSGSPTHPQPPKSGTNSASLRCPGSSGVGATTGDPGARAVEPGTRNQSGRTHCRPARSRGSVTGSI